MGRLFGTNGIRGVFGDDLTLEFIHDITLSIATYFKEGPILVGYDGRDSSPIIVKMVCAVLNLSGLDCKNAGLIPTPCLEFATKNLGYKGGIMVTASHNPPKYNGIKPVASDGVEISRESELIIEDVYFNKKWQNSPQKWGTTNKENRAIQVYLDGVKSHINLEKIISKKFKVGLDLANGTQAVIAPKFCKELGCEVFTINENIDGTFPGRGSEPTPENLKELSQLVLQSKADVGVAFDGDGDRSLFCDNEGKILTGDKHALLLCQHLLKKNPNSTIVTCMNSGSSIDTLTANSNSEVVRTEVGSVEVSRKMVLSKALIGFEENGGFMYGKHNQVRDGVMTLALILDLLASSTKTISEKVKTLPPSFTTKDKISCSQDDTKKILDTLKLEYSHVDITDGVKILINEKNWVMVRRSGTEPIIRIYAEASSQKQLDTLMSEYIQKIKSIISR